MQKSKNCLRWRTTKNFMYDIVDVNLSFIDRLRKLIQIKKLLRLTFDPERDWNDDFKDTNSSTIKVSGFDNMMYLHDKYVSEGWEGLVIRLATAKMDRKRTNDMIKIKNILIVNIKLLV